MTNPIIKPEVQAIIDRHAAIDWTRPPHNPEAAIAAYQKRLQATGLTRTVRWIADPADLDARAARAALDDWSAWAASAAWDDWAARDARDAWDAWAAWDARAARDAWDAWAARAAWDARAARAAWDARDAIGWINITIEPTPDWLSTMISTYSPMIGAYEAGAFAYILLEKEIIVLAAPATHIDDQGRLHREDGPALYWRDTKIFAWHGVVIPAEWITIRHYLSAATALTWENIEQRRAAIEIVGWDTILDKLDARVIDEDDPEIGTLIEANIPDIGRELFLRVRCGTGRSFALPVPPDMKTALQAQSWTWGIDHPSFQKPEVRT